MTKPDRSRRSELKYRRQPINPRANLMLARQPEEHVSPANRTRWQAYRSVLAAAGIDPVTLEADGRRYNAAVVRQRWVERYSSAWNRFTAEVPGFPPLAQAEWKPVYALGNALRLLFTLEQKLSGSKQFGCQYVVDDGLLTRSRDRLEKYGGKTHAQNR